MFDLDLEKILVIIIVAVVVIGPKDLPRALRAAGQWLGKARRVSNHFRAGIENMIREAELEEMEKKWREHNEAILREHPALGAADPAATAPAPSQDASAAAPSAAATTDAAPDHQTTAPPPAEGAHAAPDTPLAP